MFSISQTDTEKWYAFSRDKGIQSLGLAETLALLHRASASLPSQHQEWVL